jgi:hypothetical protein
MNRASQKRRHVAAARQRRRAYRRSDERKRRRAATEARLDDPLFQAFRKVTDTRHVFTWLASPFVADRNKPLSLYIARRVTEAVKVNYSDPFFASLTNIYHYMLYQDFREYMATVCGVTVTPDIIGHCFHAVYFTRFQNTEVYTRLWPKLGQHIAEFDSPDSTPVPVTRTAPATST